MMGCMGVANNRKFFTRSAAHGSAKMHRPVHNGMEVINRCEIVSEDDYRAQLVEYNARAIRDVQLRQGNTTNDTILGIHQMVLCQRRALLAQAVILHILGYGQAI